MKSMFVKCSMVALAFGVAASASAQKSQPQQGIPVEQQQGIPVEQQQGFPVEQQQGTPVEVVPVQPVQAPNTIIVQVQLGAGGEEIAARAFPVVVPAPVVSYEAAVYANRIAVPASSIVIKTTPFKTKVVVRHRPLHRLRWALRNKLRKVWSFAGHGGFYGIGYDPCCNPAVYGRHFGYGAYGYVVDGYRYEYRQTFVRTEAHYRYYYYSAPAPLW